MKKIVLLAIFGLFLQISCCDVFGYGMTYDTFKVSDINGGIRRNNVATSAKVVAAAPQQVRTINCGCPIYPYYAGMYYPVVITTSSRHVQHRSRKGRVGNPLYKLDPDYQNYYY